MKTKILGLLVVCGLSLLSCQKEEENTTAFGDDAKINAEDVGLKIDSYLKELNDDYLTERKHALKNVSVKLLPSKVFLEWMQLQGKYGSQSKFPRVLTNDKYIEWVKYISENNF